MRLRQIGASVLFGFLVLGGFSCDRAAPPATGAPAAAPAAPADRDAFDGARAFADLRDLVAIGPRPAGSDGAARARTLIADRLRQAGWPVSEHAFAASDDGGRSVAMVNLIGSRRGAGAGRILLGTHYDTKQIDGMRFVGANDGASGVAVLLEVARALGRGPQPLGVDLLFFDGEEAFGPNIAGGDGLYGSTALAAKLAGEGALDAVGALILVDMVGDSDLNVGLDSNSDAGLLRRARDIAEQRGDAALFDAAQTFALVDDHVPFLQRGVKRALALIDFQFGARRSPGPLWHTEGDNLRAVSAESLNRIGGMLVQLVAQLQSEPAQPKDARAP